MPPSSDSRRTVNIDGTWTHTASSKGFKVFTLSGGIESVRVYRFPSSQRISYRGSFLPVLRCSFGVYVVDYYELSGKILSENNVADQWYVGRKRMDVSRSISI
jgi:hypothetical protein